MYFETIMHERRDVADAAEAAHLIHTHNVRDFDALIWKTPNGRELAAVGDNHCNNTWGEVAVIDLTNAQQIDSITAGWCHTAAQLAEYFQKCETGEFSMGKPGNCKLPMNGLDTVPANFTCGCCGEWFESTIKEQRIFDQDNGYGICPSCDSRFSISEQRQREAEERHAAAL